MFERFTERARQVIVLAQEEVRNLKHDHIGTEHILLGLVKEEEGLGARALYAHDVFEASARDYVVRNVPMGDKELFGKISFDLDAQKVLELALREALSLGHNYIGTEHILLGLVRDLESTAMKVLGQIMGEPKPSDVAETLRNEVIKLLGGEKWIRTPPKTSWIVTQDGGALAEYKRSPKVIDRQGGIIEISGAPGEPILYISPFTYPIMIKER